MRKILIRPIHRASLINQTHIVLDGNVYTRLDVESLHFRESRSGEIFTYIIVREERGEK